jgi:molybdenum cofactor cytidylyltransferase
MLLPLNSVANQIVCREAHISRGKYLSDLFAVEPETWGLRGDPYLWDAMKAYFCNTPLPGAPDQLPVQIAAAFKFLTGKPIEVKDQFHMEKYAQGCMSSGYIAPDWWRDEAIPFLGRTLIELQSLA